jgi:ubiquinone/menaquinone biosynthesis C-methylase UbiE
VDLGSGAGNDVFIARQLTGESGRVIGIDMTDEMILKAKANNRKLGYTNVEFQYGDIESMPLPDDTAHVVISNCVINLAEDKSRVFAEIHRVLKTGGHFCVSDIVTKGPLPPSIRSSAEMYAGCVAGALDQADYLGLVSEAGFTDVIVRKLRKIDLPSDLLSKHLSETEQIQWAQETFGIYSLTVTGVKK